MEPSKKSQHEVSADEQQHEQSSQHELNEEMLASVHGGALNPAEIAHMAQVAKEAAQHHGVSPLATALDYGIGAGADFGAFTIGQNLTKKKKKS